MDFEVVDQDEELAKSRIGEVINGKWKLAHLLGCGGMAAVFAAEGPDGQRVALKMLHAHMGRSRDIRDRFLREGTVANRVGHPGVVRVLEQTSKSDPTAVLVMELLEGESLADVMRRNDGRLPMTMLLDYLDQVLDVVAAAHDQGIIHRDLKPDNLFVTRDGALKVLDFGIARVHDGLSDEQRTRTGVTLGTLPFMSPEQTLGRRSEIDGRTDLFAVGAIAFYAISGRCIHETESEGELLIAMATRSAPPLQSVAPAAPPEVCAVVDQALAFSRDARYPDARRMRVDVRALREGRSPPFASREASRRARAMRPLIAPEAVVVAKAPASVPATVVGPMPDAATRVDDSLQRVPSSHAAPAKAGIVGLMGSSSPVSSPSPASVAATPSTGRVDERRIATAPVVAATGDKSSHTQTVAAVLLLVIGASIGAYWLGAAAASGGETATDDAENTDPSVASDQDPRLQTVERDPKARERAAKARGWSSKEREETNEKAEEASKGAEELARDLRKKARQWDKKRQE